jgi:peptidoglycan/xylan/chitin deacetylase (PgdA/CDA1 family)
VLAYHRVAEPVHDPWALAVTPRHFDEQLGVLHELGRIERLDVVLDRRPRARLRQRPTFAVTFDDGYVDNLLDAVAALERHDAPATVFIATGMLDQPSFWWDVLADLTFGSTTDGAQLIDAAARLDLLSDEGAPQRVGDDREALHEELYAALVHRPASDIVSILDELSTQIGVPTPIPSGRPVTTEELLRLASHPLITIGLHTVHHRRLTVLQPEHVREELTKGARHLGELRVEHSQVLAYPFGASSPTVAEIARSVGITHAVTTDPRWVGRREDPLLVPRLNPPDLGRDAFREWIRRA